MSLNVGDSLFYSSVTALLGEGSMRLMVTVLPVR